MGRQTQHVVTDGNGGLARTIRPLKVRRVGGQQQVAAWPAYMVPSGWFDGWFPEGSPLRGLYLSD